MSAVLWHQRRWLLRRLCPAVCEQQGRGPDSPGVAAAWAPPPRPRCLPSVTCPFPKRSGVYAAQPWHSPPLSAGEAPCSPRSSGPPGPRSSRLSQSLRAAGVLAAVCVHRFTKDSVLVRRGGGVAILQLHDLVLSVAWDSNHHFTFLCKYVPQLGLAYGASSLNE